MMINWRNGKAGFVGGLKYAIKGFFQYAYSVTTVAPVIVPTRRFSGFVKLAGPFEGVAKDAIFSGSTKQMDIFSGTVKVSTFSGVKK